MLTGRSTRSLDVGSTLRDILRPWDDHDHLPEIALALWLFNHRLEADLRGRNASTAVFLAREGAFLKRLFDRSQAAAEQRGIARIPSSYLLASRKSTLLLGDIDPDSGSNTLMSALPQATWQDIASLLRVQIHEIDATDPRETITEAGEDRLRSSRVLWDLLTVRARDQGEMLRELIDEAAGGTGDLHVVDVGWKGTVRDRLAVLLAGRIVHAHLLGLVSPSPNTDLAHKTGHLFANQPRRTEWFQVFGHFKGLYELLLAAGHGSVSAYSRGASGGVTAMLDENEVERRCHVELIEPLQQRCASRFEELTRVLAPVEDEPAWLLDLVARHHARMVYRPRDEEIDFVDSLIQYDNFGAGLLLPAGTAPPQASRWPSPRRHVGGGGWPPLRMRRAGVEWQRPLYGAFKMAQLRSGRLR
jgi:hypothetical protein